MQTKLDASMGFMAHHFHRATTPVDVFQKFQRACVMNPNGFRKSARQPGKEQGAIGGPLLEKLSEAAFPQTAAEKAKDAREAAEARKARRAERRVAKHLFRV